MPYFTRKQGVLLTNLSRQNCPYMYMNTWNIYVKERKLRVCKKVKEKHTIRSRERLVVLAVDEVVNSSALK